MAGIDPDGTAVVRIAPPAAGQQPIGNAGSVVMVEVRSPRSVQHQRKYWALLRAAVRATGRWPNAEACHRWVKWELQMFTPLATDAGAVVVEWDSTDFATMSQRRFNRFYEAALNRVAAEIGVDPGALQDEGKSQ